MEFIFNATFLNDKCANADMKIDIDIPQGILATLCWADESGKPLENYLPLKSLPLIDGKGTYTFKNSLMIPENAAKIRCRIYNDSMLEIVLPELCKDIPAEKKLEPQKPISRIFITSDIHVGGNYFNNRANRSSAFRFIHDTNPDFVLIAGDITDNSNTNEFEEARNQIETELDGLPVFVCTGNHDLSPYKPGTYPHFEEMTEFFKWQCERNSKLGADDAELNEKYYFSTRINGTQIIVLNENDVNNQAYVGYEQRSWLDSELCKSDGARYRIILSHFHQKGTVCLTEALKDKAYISDDSEVQEIIDRHKNIIHVSGHTHHNFDSDVVNASFDSRSKVFYINAGCAVWNGVGMNSRREYYIKNRCTGHLLEVYDGYMITRGVEFVSGKYIPRCLYKAEM